MFSPTLFSLIIKGIEGCGLELFADIVLWKSGTDLQKMKEDIILHWAHKHWAFAVNHKMSFNPSKSTVGFFTNNRNLYSYQSSILLNHQTVSVKKHPKCLGYVLDPEILKNKHIEHIMLKARKHFKILKYISGHDWVPVLLPLEIPTLL